MKYQIMEQRLNMVLERDKCSDPDRVCEILKGELSPVIANYIELNKDVEVRFRKIGERLLFQVEIEASRLRPFGYLPRGF